MTGYAVPQEIAHLKESRMDVPRPEPVLDEAKVASKLTGLVTALATLAVVLGYANADQADGLVTAVVAAGGAAVTVVNMVVPLVRARRARALVTPLEAPDWVSLGGR